MRMNAGVTKDEFNLARRRHGLKSLGRWFKPYLGHFSFCVVLALITNGAILAKPWIIKRVIDDYLGVVRGGDAMVLLLATAYFLLVAAAAALNYAQTCYVTWIGQKIMHGVRTELFAHIQNMSMPFFDKNSTGRILTRVTNDVEALSDLFSTVVVNIFRDIIMVVGIVALMFRLDPGLAIFGIGCVPLIAAATVIYRYAARKNFIKVKGMIARINGFLAENISGMRLVQIFHREKEKFAELEELDREFMKYSLREVVLNSFSRPIVEIINNLTISVLIVASLHGISEGAVKVGVLYAFISYIKQFFEPISTLAEQYTTIQSAIVSADRVLEILETTDSQEDALGGRAVPALRGHIEFHNVWFAYSGENWVLKDLSFAVQPGWTAAIVGETGSGKSTVISLLARFYEIQRGSIHLDGVDIREYNIRDLRRRIAVVIQDVFLFSGDISSNIRLNRNDIGDDRVREAARFVNADKFIDLLPGNYREPVKERGCTLSSGQRQLVSFARAIAFNPSILVLDEATANIDTETERTIQRAMENIAEGRTSIIIAHRLSTIRHADRIFVLADGKLSEEGRHDQLVAAGGVYSRLCSARKGREE